MKKYLLIFSILTVFSVGFISNASAIILTFDDIPSATQNSYGVIGTYAGYTFASDGSHNRLDWVDTVGSSWNYGSISGDFTLLNNMGGNGIITSSTGLDFTFTGLYSRVWSHANPRNISIEGYNNGALAWASTGLTLNQTWSYFTGSDTLIDTLYLNFGNHFLVDNLELNGAAPVPEPATFILLGSGLAGLAFYRRKRK